MKRRTCILAATLLCAALARGTEEEKLSDGLYATIKTDKGDIVLALEFEKTPMTVANFVGLAEGTKKSNKPAGTPFYDGIKFHRVIKDFMIQGGCPAGNGTGGPGYDFPDEIDSSLKHDRAGILSMANRGPGTNGSQFFITHGPTAWLDGKHTVFGHVVRGQDVVSLIAAGDVIRSVKIERIGDKALKFASDQAAFEKYRAEKDQIAKQKVEQAGAEFEKTVREKWTNAVKTASGVWCVVEKEGEGASPRTGDAVRVHYTGELLNGRVFDSSVQRGEPIAFAVGTGQVIPGWDAVLLEMKKGEKRLAIIPPALAYGEKGIPDRRTGEYVIPPNSPLVFRMELVDFQARKQ